MSPRRKQYLFAAIGVVVAALCASMVWLGMRARNPPAPSAKAPAGERETTPLQADPTPARNAQPAPKKPTPGAAAERSVHAPSKDEATEQQQALTEEQFVELAAKIRVMQRAVAGTPEGQKALEKLVRQFLASERVTRADLQAFAETLEPADVERLEKRIEQRVAEFGQKPLRVQVRPSKGARVLEEDRQEATGGQ